MKKTFTLLIATLFSVSMFAQDPAWLLQGDEWDNETKTLTVNSNPGSYQDKGDIEHLVIAEGVTEIGEGLFNGCWNIIDIIIPASVTNIAKEAFYGCSSVADVYCYADPDNLTWNDGWCDDFKQADHATTCHVMSSYLSTYISKWGNTTYQENNSGVNVTFVGDLSDPAIHTDPTPSTTTITWNQTQISGISLSCSNVDDTHSSDPIDGITLSITKTSSNGDYCMLNNRDLYFAYSCGKATFTSSVGDITKIVITSDYIYTCEEDYLSAGWSVVKNGNEGTLTWAGTPSNKVELYCSNSAYSLDFNLGTIEFTISSGAAPVDPTPSVSTITWDGTDINSVSLNPAYGNTEATSAIKDITASLTRTAEAGSACKFQGGEVWITGCGELTFESSVGNISGIVITCSDVYYEPTGFTQTLSGYATGWAYDSDTKTFTWDANETPSGEPSSQVTISGDIDFLPSSIVFTVVSAGGDEPGDDPVVENKTATSIVIYENYGEQLSQFTLMDNDCGTLGAYTLPNVYLRESELLNRISGMPLTITSSDESVVRVSLSDYIDGENTCRTINFERLDYGHAVITVSFAGNDDYASSQASFDYDYFRNTSPMAACHVQDLGGNTHTDLVMTEGDKIALDFVRNDGNAMCYFLIGTATTTHKSCWKYDEEISHRVFYPHAAGLDTIVYEYFRSNSLDEQVNKKEDFHYWPYRQTIKIPVEIKPFLTPVTASAQTQMNLNPATNASMAFGNTVSDLYNPAEEQLEINSVVTAENLQLALDSMGTGTPEWNAILPGATTFNVNAGKGKIKMECQTEAGYELQVLVRDHGTATISQPSMGFAEVSYNVDEVTAVLVYLRPTGGSPAPQRRVQAAKKAAAKAVIKSITIAPEVNIAAKEDPDNAGVYYTTFFDGSQNYRLATGTEAYAATISGEDMILNKVAEGGQIIPADNAFILKSNSASVALTPTDETPVSVSVANSLHGTDSEMAAPANCYVLSGHSTDYSVTGVGFYQFSGTLPAHKAYLTVSGGAAYAPKRLRFVFNQGQTATGVENVQGDNVQSTKVLRDGQLIIQRGDKEYNAQGQIVK